MWEDGFCRPRVAECLEDIDGEDPVRKAFIKMSIQLYNYGEGLMGKVASDKCHKWVFKEPSECEPNISNYWQSSFDAVRTITDCGTVPPSPPRPLSLSAVSACPPALGWGESQTSLLGSLARHSTLKPLPTSSSPSLLMK